MAKAQRMVRVDVDVLERLQQYQDALRSAATANTAGVPDHNEWRDCGPWLSLSGVISYLLDKVEAHKARRKRSAAKRRKGGKPS